LELGFGAGLLLQKLGKAQRTVIGVDRSPAMTAVAMRRLCGQSGGVEDFSASAYTQQKQNRANLINGDAEELPLPDHCVDTIVSTFPAPYILQPATLAECRRVLKGSRVQPRLPQDQRGAALPGRLLIVGLWVRPLDKGLIPRLMRWMPFFYGGSTPELKHSIVRSLEKHGFQAHIQEVCAGDAELGVIIAQPIPA
jgi:ubiquinone/menaquinone biosynthesis C-methylase UbiE